MVSSAILKRTAVTMVTVVFSQSDCFSMFSGFFKPNRNSTFYPKDTRPSSRQSFTTYPFSRRRRHRQTNRQRLLLYRYLTINSTLFSVRLLSFTVITCVISHFAARFARISSIFLNFNWKCVYSPSFNFGLTSLNMLTSGERSEPWDVMVLAEGVTFLISTHNLCPPTIDDGSTPLPHPTPHPIPVSSPSSPPSHPHPQGHLRSNIPLGVWKFVIINEIFV